MYDTIPGARRAASGLPDPDVEWRFYDRVPSRRLAAWVVDVLIVSAMCVVVIPVVGILTLGLAFFAIPFVYAVVSFLYRVATLAGGSATWGMRLMGIELRAGDGSRFDLGHAFAHTALYAVCWAVTLLQAASVVLVLTTRRQQTLPDLALGTAAINAPED